MSDISAGQGRFAGAVASSTGRFDLLEKVFFQNFEDAFIENLICSNGIFFLVENLFLHSFEKFDRFLFYSSWKTICVLSNPCTESII